MANFGIVVRERRCQETAKVSISLSLLSFLEFCKEPDDSEAFDKDSKLTFGRSKKKSEPWEIPLLKVKFSILVSHLTEQCPLELIKQLP